MTTKKYGMEDIYRMVTLVLHYPDAGHSGKQFWSSMMSIYGDSVLEGRNFGALREKWRKIAKEHPSDLEEYKKTLIGQLPKELIEDIEQKITDKLSDPTLNHVINKRHSTLLPNIFNGEGVKKIKLGNGKDGEGAVKKSIVKKSTLGRTKVGKALDSIEDIRNCIDLGQIIVKKSSGISKAIKRLGLSFIDDEAKDFLLGKDQNAAFAKELLQSTKELEQKIQPLPKLPLEIKLWTRLEEMALMHPENQDMQEWLLREKGLETIENHKKSLGI